jgi:hypothetical protein
MRVKKNGDVHEEKVLGFIPLRLLIIFLSRDERQLFHQNKRDIKNVARRKNLFKRKDDISLFH